MATDPNGNGPDPTAPVPTPPGGPALNPGQPGGPPRAGGGTPPPASPPPAATPDPLSTLSQTDRNAYDLIMTELQQFGLQSLAPLLLQYAQQGYGADTISLNLQNTDQWKTRFAGNQERIKNGFGVLDPATYIATESQIIATARAYGLPTGMYDSAAGAAGVIGADISPAEFQDRALQAWNYTTNGDQAAVQALQQFYGADQSHAVAFFMDPEKAQALIDKQSASAAIGASAIRNSVTGLGVNQAEQFYAQGISQQQAQSGLQKLGAIEPQLLQAAQRAGIAYNDQTALQDFVAGQGPAQQQRFNIAQNEESMFQPTGGVVSGRPAGGSF